MQYFNQGAKTLSYLASTQMFKEHYKMEPGEMQRLMSWIYIPWTIKVVYGILSDNLPICGSHRRSYIFIGAILQISTYVALAAG